MTDLPLRLFQQAHADGRLVALKQPDQGLSLKWLQPNAPLLDVTNRAAKLQAVLELSGLWAAAGAHRSSGAGKAFADFVNGLEGVTDVVDFMTAHRIIYKPTLIWNGEAYVSPPKGFDLDLRTYSLAEPLHPAPLEDEPLRTFLDAMGLEGANRAKVLAFYAGCLLRHCFGPMPAILLRSPYKNVGKSTIVRLGACIYLGMDRADTMTWKGITEFNKELSTWGERPPFVWIDNVDTRHVGKPFTCPAIATATQNGSIDCRILGESRMVRIERPLFGITLQSGMVDQDLADRLLYVMLNERPQTTIAQDMLLFVQDQWAAVRNELAQVILRTKPLSANSARRYRFNDFYRHVAPVLEHYDLDPQLIVDTSATEAQPEVIELGQLLSRIGESEPDRAWSPNEVLQHLRAHEFMNLAALIQLHDSKKAQELRMKGLFREVPSTVDDREHRYVFTTDDAGKIRVNVEEK